MGSQDSSSEIDNKLRIIFFPLMSPGHMIPLVDMARVFAQRGVHATIVTTPANAANLRRAISASSASGHPLQLSVIPFPSPDLTGLSLGQENLSTVPAAGFETFVRALFLLREPLDALIRELHPHVIVSDSLFTWTADLAASYGIPRLVFHGAGVFPNLIIERILYCLPLDPSTDSFSVSCLSHDIKCHKDGLPELLANPLMLQLMGEAEGKSYGVVVNTYREMEPAFVDHYKSTRRVWCVGPVSLCLRAEEDKADRGESPAVNEASIKAWLDTKPAASVVYVCFGSLCHFGAAQLRAIALGLEASGAAFLWVVRREAEEDVVAEKEWLPEGYEERVKDRGLIVRGWAPQVVVLNHAAVGWFVTHCGWNSLQEAVCAGKPMLTWPLFHEQFINQELLVEVIGVGVRMWEGFRRSKIPEEGAVVSAEEVAAKVKTVMAEGEEVESVRSKAREYAAAARRAVEKSGSTYEDVGKLIEELEARRKEGSNPV